MAVHSITHIHSARPRHVPAWSVRAAIGQGWSVFVAMVRARQTRRMLGDMDDRLLADIGIGRGDAATEASRPMWDLAPSRDQLR